MNGTSASLILLAALIGHGGLHIGIYNRVNSLGWPRKRIKRVVKLFFLNTILLPIAICLLEEPALTALVQRQGHWTDLAVFTRLYIAVSLASWLFLGIPWVLSRPIFGLGWVNAPRRIRVVDVSAVIDRPLALTTKARLESRLPFNQLLELSIEEVELPVKGLPEALDGYRIAHLSDVHLTGDIDPAYAKFAVQQAGAAKPDLIALTGDVIDAQPCIDWLVDIFSPAEATDGCFFILGNHDTRVVDSRETRDAMDRAGWIDLGGMSRSCCLRGVSSQLIGNEYPWFGRPEVDLAPADFRLLLSHSPDQFGWARQKEIQLMLAGHTHGGQGRLPLAGPILSPSRHGSRYASGDFYREPTTLHVTRGLGGVHLMRINCRPELSILNLRVCAE